MSVFVWNILLALAWVAVTGEISVYNFAVGFALSFFILFITRRAGGAPAYFERTVKLVLFLGFFLKEVIVANLRTARHVLRPDLIRPGIIAIPLDARTDVEITLLANLITLTPGTLSLDVSSDRETLYIHSMDVSDPDAIRAEIKRGLERRLLEVLR